MTLAGRPRHALLTGLVAALVALVAPQPVTLDPRTTGNDELAERLRHMTGGHGHLGLAVGLVDGATGQTAGVGLTGGDPDTAVTADTSFEIGSVTKVFNGMLLADMVAEGRITPETTLRELYPGTRFADPEVAGITLAELASHRAGLPVVAPDGLPGLLHAVRANWEATSPFSSPPCPCSTEPPLRLKVRCYRSTTPDSVPRDPRSGGSTPTCHAP